MQRNRPETIFDPNYVFKLSLHDINRLVSPLVYVNQ